MIQLFTILIDITIIAFDLMIYIMIVPLRRENKFYQMTRAVGCVLIIAFYIIGAYVLGWPASVAATMCMTIPSFVLFFALSLYRDSRYVLAFCLVDTVSLIVAFTGRYISMVAPQLTWLAFLVVAGLFLAILLPGRRFFRAFRELLKTTEVGWGSMAAATIFIYFAMVFFLSYPKPLVERMEYAPTWMVFAAVVAACYVVFFQSVLKTRRIQEQNQRLEKEKAVYQMAYTDSITGLSNRAAWMERINALESQGAVDRLCIIVFDCDRFKQINDTYGHHVGDVALHDVALALAAAFPEGASFRLGGDEFAVLLTDMTEEEILSRLERLAADLRRKGEAAGIPLSVTAGYAFSRPEERLENTYIRADQRMYEEKRKGAGEAVPR